MLTFILIINLIYFFRIDVYNEKKDKKSVFVTDDMDTNVGMIEWTHTCNSSVTSDTRLKLNNIGSKNGFN